MLPRSHRLFRTRGGRLHLRSRAVLQKKPGNFGEMVSPKPGIFRNFWDFGSARFPKNSGNFWGFGHCGFSKFPGNFNEEEK